MNSIQTFFETFRRETIHPSASPKQVEDCRVAFYGGAGAMMKMLSDISKHPNEDAAARMMEGLDVEIRAFFMNYEPPKGL